MAVFDGGGEMAELWRLGGIRLSAAATEVVKGQLVICGGVKTNEGEGRCLPTVRARWLLRQGQNFHGLCPRLFNGVTNRTICPSLKLKSQFVFLCDGPD